jgi:hypothetical protein
MNSQAIVVAAKVLDELAVGWRKSDRLDIVFLRALAQLTQRYPDRATDGFDPWELAKQIGSVLGRKWAADDAREVISDKVRQQWSRLDDTWQTKREGVLQSFQERQLDFYVEPDRIEGGGSSKPTRYRLVPRKMEDVSDVVLDEGGPDKKGCHRPVGRAPTIVRYICEDIEDASLLARWFASGFTLTGWRRGLLRVVLLLGVLAGVLPIFGLAISLMGPKSLTTLIYSGISVAVICYSVWITIGHLLMLHRWRITLAPWWMQSVDDDRLLEWRCPPRYQVKSIKGARYTAICPLCSGKMVVRSGGLRYLGGLVGRCEDAPDAHVFSFDHVLREGARIRC